MTGSPTLLNELSMQATMANAAHEKKMVNLGQQALREAARKDGELVQLANDMFGPEGAAKWFVTPNPNSRIAPIAEFTAGKGDELKSRLQFTRVAAALG